MKQERGPGLNAGRARVLARRGPGLYRRPIPARDRFYPGLREQSGGCRTRTRSLPVLGLTAAERTPNLKLKT
jgi:hypothetical protein